MKVLISFNAYARKLSQPTWRSFLQKGVVQFYESRRISTNALNFTLFRRTMSFIMQHTFLPSTPPPPPDNFVLLKRIDPDRLSRVRRKKTVRPYSIK